jgi:tetratricopeptide (TPR) repeat protein
MARVEKTVFISYRRTNAPWALAIYQNLNNNGYDVFFDFNGIASGDFESVILGNIKARAHFIVLLTPSALERCNEPGDWLRREIETALKTKRNMIPLMLEGFDFGTPAIANQLTGKLAALKRYNALDVPASYFMAAMERLREKFLNVPLEGVLHPPSSFAERATKRQQAAADIAPAVQEEELTAQQWFERGLDTKDLDEKVRFYSQAIRLKPNYPAAFNNRGIARHDKGDLEGELQDFNEAIRLKPDYSEAFNNRGNARKAKGDWEGALQDYNEAIRLKPDSAGAFNNRGNARQGKGDLEGALEDYDEAIHLKPDSAEAFNNRGVARRATGDLEGALQDHNEAIRLKLDYPYAFNNRGLVRHDKGDLEGSLQDYDEAIRLKPDYADPFNNRGIARHDKGDLEGSSQDYDEAIRLKPDYADPFNNRGIARRAKGDLEGALQDFNEAIRLKPDYANAYYNRTIIFQGKANYGAAIADLQKYLDLGGGTRYGDQKEVEEKIRDLRKKLAASQEKNKNDGLIQRRKKQSKKK